MMQVSVLILTYNEEDNISGCIDSAKAVSNDVVVLDSVSSDGTVEIAEKCGARVYQNSFSGYASQRNFGLHRIPYECEWVLMLDADEVLTSELSQEILNLNPDVGDSLFRFRRKDYFSGRWIKRCSGYPTWFGRLVKLGYVTIEREVNEEYRAIGRVRHLQGHIQHFPFNKGLAWWIERHNRYSSLEAEVRASKPAVPFSHIFMLDPVVRRAAQKALLYRMPLRPLIVFLYLYFIRLGVLDGVAGLRFVLLRTVYEYLIDLKCIEKNKGL